MMSGRPARLLAGLAFMLALCSCASYQSKVQGFRDQLRSHQPDAAAEKIKEKAFTDSDDQIVYLFEYSTAEQIAQKYDESIKGFLKAEDLTDIKDYHSISRIGGSLILNEGLKQYKGDDFEKVMINAMLAIDYVMQGKLEDARVECRKLNDKLYKFRFEGKKKYDQNPFAFYLSAMIWEANRDWDTAYIDFKRAYDLNPNLEYLHEDLIRAGINAQRREDVALWQKKFGKIKPANLKETGDLVLIYQQGWGPVKRPNPAFPRIPKLYPSFSQTMRARLEIEGGQSELSQTVLNVTDVAMKSLDEQYAGLIATRVAGIGVKAVLADQIRQKNQLLGELAWIGMNLADQADLRQWVSLPATIQVAKLHLKPGKYRVRSVGLNGAGLPTGEGTDWEEVTVLAKKKIFLNWRSLK